MALLRNIMIVMATVITLYTLAVIMRDGIGLLAVFFGDLIALGWRGQFNLDFACYLMLSGLWLAWRTGFSSGGVLSGLIASVAGMLYFAPVMLLLISRSKGDLRKLLLGVYA